MHCSPPGSYVHGILQARILEWVAMSSSRGSSQPRDWTQVSCIAGKFFTTWAIREALPNASSRLQSLRLNTMPSGLPWWLSGKESAYRCRRHGLDSWSQKSHMPVHPNYWACALEPRSCNYWAHTPQLLKPVHPGAHAPQHEKPL